MDGSHTPVYARRGYSPATGEPVTFTSWDAADERPWGWLLGWHDEGHVWEGYRLTHVSTPSWRCRAPVALSVGKAA